MVMADSVERTVIDGKEIKVQMDRDAYAGEWVKEAFAARRTEPDCGLLAGYATDRRGQLRPAVLAPDDLKEHCGIFGTTGAGKTTFMTNLMIQWAFSDHGFCFVAPFREEARELLHKLPADRLEDIVWIDTNPRYSESLFDGDTNRVVPIDFLNLSPPPSQSSVVAPDPQLIASHFVDLLKEDVYAFEEMADDLTAICRALIPVFINSDDVQSLADINDICPTGDETAQLRSFVERSAADDVWQTIEQALERDDAILWPIFTTFFNQYVNASTLPDSHLTTNTPLTMAEAIAENKIIVVAGTGTADQRLRMIAGTIIQRLWTAAQQQASTETIYPVILDQIYGSIAGDGQLYQEILTATDSSPLSLFLCSQYPGQLSDSLAECIVSQVGTLISFYQTRGTYVHSPEEMRPIDNEDIRSAYIPHTGVTDITLSRYDFRVRVPDHEPYVATVFAEHPRTQSNDEVTTAIKQSLKRYGIAPA
jgi:hypothetical protein